MSGLSDEHASRCTESGNRQAGRQENLSGSTHVQDAFQSRQCFGASAIVGLSDGHLARSSSNLAPSSLQLT